jgi:hypothetical protein
MIKKGKEGKKGKGKHSYCRGRDGGYPPPAVLRTDPDVRHYLILSSRSYLEFLTPEASL